MTDMTAADEHRDRTEPAYLSLPPRPLPQDERPTYEGAPATPFADAVLERRSDGARLDAELTVMMSAVAATGGLEAWCQQLPPSTMAFAFAAVLRHHNRNAQ